MAIAADYMDGNTHIIIKDDHCVKTQKEIDDILKEVAQIYSDNFARKAVKEKEKSEKTAV